MSQNDHAEKAITGDWPQPHMTGGEQIKLGDCVDALDPNPALTKAYAEQKAVCQEVNHRFSRNAGWPYCFVCGCYDPLYVTAKRAAKRYVDLVMGKNVGYEKYVAVLEAVAIDVEDLLRTVLARHHD